MRYPPCRLTLGERTKLTLPTFVRACYFEGIRPDTYHGYCKRIGNPCSICPARKIVRRAYEEDRLPSPPWSYVPQEIEITTIIELMEERDE